MVVVCLMAVFWGVFPDIWFIDVQRVREGDGGVLRGGYRGEGGSVNRLSE